MVDWAKRYATRASSMAASEIRELLKLRDRPDIISLAGGIPDPALFPCAAVAGAYSRILGDPARAAAALQYSASEGYQPLRAWIADYMAGLGVAFSADHILITPGSQQALGFLAQFFISPGAGELVAKPANLPAPPALSAPPAGHGP